MHTQTHFNTKLYEDIYIRNDLESARNQIQDQPDYFQTLNDTRCDQLKPGFIPADFTWLAQLTHHHPKELTWVAALAHYFHHDFSSFKHWLDQTSDQKRIQFIREFLFTGKQLFIAATLLNPENTDDPFKNALIIAAEKLNVAERIAFRDVFFTHLAEEKKDLSKSALFQFILLLTKLGINMLDVTDLSPDFKNQFSKLLFDLTPYSIVKEGHSELARCIFQELKKRMPFQGFNKYMRQLISKKIIGTFHSETQKSRFIVALVKQFGKAPFSKQDQRSFDILAEEIEPFTLCKCPEGVDVLQHFFLNAPQFLSKQTKYSACAAVEAIYFAGKAPHEKIIELYNQLLNFSPVPIDLLTEFQKTYGFDINLLNHNKQTLLDLIILEKKWDVLADIISQHPNVKCTHPTTHALIPPSKTIFLIYYLIQDNPKAFSKLLSSDEEADVNLVMRYILSTIHTKGIAPFIRKLFERYPHALPQTFDTNSISPESSGTVFFHITGQKSFDLEEKKETLLFLLSLPSQYVIPALSERIMQKKSDDEWNNGSLLTFLASLKELDLFEIILKYLVKNDAKNLIKYFSCQKKTTSNWLQNLYLYFNDLKFDTEIKKSIFKILFNCIPFTERAELEYFSAFLHTLKSDAAQECLQILDDLSIKMSRKQIQRILDLRKEGTNFQLAFINRIKQFKKTDQIKMYGTLIAQLEASPITQDDCRILQELNDQCSIYLNDLPFLTEAKERELNEKLIEFDAKTNQEFIFFFISKHIELNGYQQDRAFYETVFQKYLVYFYTHCQHKKFIQILQAVDNHLTLGIPHDFIFKIMKNTASTDLRNELLTALFSTHFELKPAFLERHNQENILQCIWGNALFSVFTVDLMLQKMASTLAQDELMALIEAIFLELAKTTDPNVFPKKMSFILALVKHFEPRKDNADDMKFLEKIYKRGFSKRLLSFLHQFDEREPFGASIDLVLKKLFVSSPYFLEEMENSESNVTLAISYIQKHTTLMQRKMDVYTTLFNRPAPPLLFLSHYLSAFKMELNGVNQRNQTLLGLCTLQRNHLAFVTVLKHGKEDAAYMTTNKTLETPDIETLKTFLLLSIKTDKSEHSLFLYSRIKHETNAYAIDQCLFESSSKNIFLAVLDAHPNASGTLMYPKTKIAIMHHILTDYLFRSFCKTNSEQALFILKHLLTRVQDILLLNDTVSGIIEEIFEKNAKLAIERDIETLNQYVHRPKNTQKKEKKGGFFSRECKEGVAKKYITALNNRAPIHLTDFEQKACAEEGSKLQALLGKLHRHSLHILNGTSLTPTKNRL